VGDEGLSDNNIVNASVRREVQPGSLAKEPASLNTKECSMVSKSILAWIGAGLLTFGLLPVATSAAARHATASKQVSSAKHLQASKPTVTAKKHAVVLKHAVVVKHAAPSRHKSLHTSQHTARHQSRTPLHAKHSHSSRKLTATKRPAKQLHATTKRPAKSQSKHASFRAM
jgi:hypothetical protein